MKKSLFVMLTLSLIVVGCNKGAKKSAAPAAVEDGAMVIATINGENVTVNDIQDLVADKMQKINMELYDIRKGGVDQLVEEKLLAMEAKKQGVSEEELIKKEVTSKIEVSDKDIQGFYTQRKDSFKDKKIEEVKDRIRSYLVSSQTRNQRQTYIAKLKKDAKVTLLIEPPRFNVSTDDDPSIGPKDAPITIIEFTDYQCPFCGRARDAINQILKEYEGKVHYVLRDFPLSFHKDAQKAHEAAECANDQDKYWDYNKILFNNQRSLKVEELKSYAKRIKLDLAKFDKCLDSDKYKDEVQADLRDGQNNGVTGTPSFFINGRNLSGARPFEDFKKIIDDELERAN
jgi:protein-disulfide isomerase